MSMLSTADYFTFFQIVSGRSPGAGEQLLQGVLAVALVFLPGVLLLAMFAICGSGRSPATCKAVRGPTVSARSACCNPSPTA